MSPGRRFRGWGFLRHQDGVATRLGVDVARAGGASASPSWARSSQRGPRAGSPAQDASKVVPLGSHVTAQNRSERLPWTQGPPPISRPSGSGGAAAAGADNLSDNTRYGTGCPFHPETPRVSRTPRAILGRGRSPPRHNGLGSAGSGYCSVGHHLTPRPWPVPRRSSPPSEPVCRAHCATAPIADTSRYPSPIRRHSSNASGRNLNRWSSSQAT